MAYSGEDGPTGRSEYVTDSIPVEFRLTDDEDPEYSFESFSVTEMQSELLSRVVLGKGVHTWYRLQGQKDWLDAGGYESYD